MTSVRWEYPKNNAIRVLAGGGFALAQTEGHAALLSSKKIS
jgi:hypothetical protein